jgi:bifunctional UDP-N-acetylglucosamine pyrophosphorylase/glucosamine-1-phosphate N-acetyltransferase
VDFDVVILAAGQGTRMRSKLPKVLHKVAGKPMVGHAIDTARQLGASAIHVVIGHGAEQVKDYFSGSNDVNWVIQQEQLGTGHAVAQAMSDIGDEKTVLVVYGDVPLVAADTLQQLVETANEQTLALLTVTLETPTGYGRIVRNSEGAVQAIVEQKDANDEQLKITEVNTGILAVAASKLAQWLPTLSSENAQGEYYLTDIISLSVGEGMTVTALHPNSAMEVEGANNREQVAGLERFYQQQQAKRLMAEGTSLADPSRIDIRGNVTVGQDIFIDVNCVFIGEVTIGDDVTIGPNCVIENTSIGSNTVIKANSVIENAQIASHCDIGPFARLRPGSVLADKAKVGNFVELKNTTLGEGSKVNHLSYVGDSEVGIGCNIGAGTITCNYDGANKFKTTLGNNVFIGSNSTLVAPIKISDNSFVGAGSTVTKAVPSDSLAIARGKQRNIEGWQRPVKSEK